MRYILIIGLTVVSFAVFAQNSQSIVFKELTHNFGTINEENGIVEHMFHFSNNGSTSLVITNVSASCGCTTSGYSSDTVPPGGQGYVKASFNPYNRPGAFKKSLTVMTNSDPNMITLYIEGNVKPRPRSIEEEFPVKLGVLRFRSGTLHLGNIKNNAPFTKKFDIYNDSEFPVSLTKNVQKPKNVELSFDSNVIKPKSLGSIAITFNPEESELGYLVENINLQTNEPAEQKEKQLRLVATVEEYFPPMTAQELARAPKIAVDKRQYDFGSTSAGSKITASFNLSNVGHNPLLIRSVKSHCECVTVEVDKESLKRNDRSVLKAVFDTAGRQGNQLVSITIITNDPQEPMKVVRIKGRIN